VPKPGTPFENEAFCDLATLRRRAALLKQVRSIRGCALKVASLEAAWVESRLAAGDESLAPLLIAAARGKTNLKTLLRGVRS
jgi:hypothetical protein